MKRLGFSVRHLAALAAIAALCGAPSRAQVPATGIFVESENYIQPNGNSTLNSGPNSGSIGTQGAIVSRDADAAFSGGFHIGFFDYYDWLEYDVDIPEDGTYDILYRYASDWPSNDTFPQDLNFYTSGQQVFPPGAPRTAGWGDYQLYTLPTSVALKKGTNRFRVRIRPDSDLVTTLGGSMNMDYIKFVKSGDYPNLVAVSGTVTAMVDGTATPIEGALVSEDPDPAKGALFAEAAHVTRTDASGKYTLYLSPGSHSVTAFYNGYAANTQTVTAPGTKDFSLTYNGRFEAELLDATNPGRGNADGVLAAYSAGSYSAHGFVRNGGKTAGKFALYNHVIVPSAGAYDITLHYSSDQTPDVNTAYQWSVNGGGGPLVNLAGTGDFLTFQDSTSTVIGLKAGKNSLKWTDQDAAHFARVDYFTVTPSAQPHGTLNVVVTDTGGKPVPGAHITVVGDNATYTDVADGTGKLSLAVAAGSYNVTANKSGSSATVTTAVADGGTGTANITLSITAILVEGEAFTATGPDLPGNGVQVVNMDNASGGKVLTDLFGAGDTGAGSNNYRWAEWVVNVPQDGMYKFGMSYATRFSPTDFTLTVDTTSARFNYPAPDTGGPDLYTDFTTTNGTPIELPLVAGPNTVRITSGKGGVNIDYLTFDRDTTQPAMTFTSITGTVSGTDGTGTAPIRGALVFVSFFTPDPVGAYYSATTDASGHYTLHVPTAGQNGDGTSGVAALAPGYTTSSLVSVHGGTTHDIVLNVNNVAGTTPPSLDLDFTDPPTIVAEVLGVGSGRISTTVNQIAFVSPGPDTWIDLNVNAPRSGLYDMSMNYSSAWLPEGSEGHLPITVGGTTVNSTFPMTGAWNNIQTLTNFVTLPLQAGPNTVRLAFPDAAANINYMDFIRSGDLPPVASTDIDGNGVTDLLDAVTYARRLAGTVAGATPDVTGDGASNAADVRRILSVAGGLL